MFIMSRMNIFIDNKSGVSIYDQIYTQIKTQILNGSLAEDEPLPSIRTLAKDLRISVISTKRAYDELEKEGFVYAVAAKGFFVAPKNLELVKEQNLRQIESYLEKIHQLSVSCGLTRKDIVEMLDILEEKET